MVKHTIGMITVVTEHCNPICPWTQYSPFFSKVTFEYRFFVSEAIHCTQPYGEINIDTRELIVGIGKTCFKTHCATGYHCILVRKIIITYTSFDTRQFNNQASILGVACLNIVQFKCPQKITIMCTFITPLLLSNSLIWYYITLLHT